MDPEIVNDTVCRVFGCGAPYWSDPGCSRCGAYYYDPEYHNSGWFHIARVWISERIAYLRHISPVHRCGECRRPFWRGRKYQPCCSKECEEVWFPF